MLIKLTMIETENTVEGEDDIVTVEAVTAVTFVEAGSIRSIHARKPQHGTRPEGTRIAFNNGSQFSVTEAPEVVAGLMGFIGPNEVN